MQSPVRIPTKARQKTPSAPPTYSPGSALGSALAPAAIRLTQPRLPCFRGSSVNCSLHRSQLPADAEHRTNKRIRRQHPPGRNHSPCRLLPTAKPSLPKRAGERDLVRFPPTRHRSPLIASMRFTTLLVSCWRRSASCRSIQQLAERSRMRNCSCDVRPLRLRVAKYEYTFRNP